MAYIPQQSTNTGLYIPTTTVYDSINASNISDELKQILVVLYQNVNNIALSLNAKDSGLYTLTEFVNGQGWFNLVTSVNDKPRSDFRKAFYINLPPGITSFNHNIVGNPLTFTRMYGVGNDTVGFNYYPFDSSGVGNNIEIIGNATQITVTNHTGITFNVTYIVVEFLKN